MNGGQLPPHVVPFCVVAAAVAACLPLAAFFLQRARLRLQLEGTRPQNVAQVRCNFLCPTCEASEQLEGTQPQNAAQVSAIPLLFADCGHVACFLRLPCSESERVSECSQLMTCDALPLQHVFNTCIGQACAYPQWKHIARPAQ